ncbi:hypothetical protein [Staphylococcus gallinarum]|nr:hypothetical protein [Staphylococcus gallinarum]MCD8827228.1 hypothetical protein [Staphylococcus gallinarum]
MLKLYYKFNFATEPENIQSNSNDNDRNIETKNKETQNKKGFWGRLFSG